MVAHENFSSTNQPDKRNEHAGRPKGSGLKEVYSALERFEKKYSCSWWDLVFERSRKSDVIMRALVQKLAPDQIEGNLNHDVNVSFITNPKGIFESGNKH